MQGYEVEASDGHLGTVVGVKGDNVIVKHGTIFKQCHAVPMTFVEVDDAQRVVHTTLSKRMIEDSPKVKEDQELGTREIAAYYGLAEGADAPGTEGYGALNADDPAVTADQQALSAGLEPAEAQRARIRENMNAGDTYGSPGRQVIPPNPHEVGGRETGER